MSLPAPACLLFDLDGTLLDTAGDMGRSLNQLRREQDLPPLPLATIRPWVSQGSAGMLKVGFDLQPDQPAFETLRQRFLELYAGDLCRDTVLFPQMARVLEHLEAQKLPWGVVTNKPGWLTDPLLGQLGLFQRATCVVSGDTTPRRKPHPDPLLYAARLAGVRPEACWYVGDAQRDIEAGRRAGMTTLAACFGYILAHERPALWGADRLLEDAGQLLALLAQTRP
ncbi:MAG: HAD-IA family hydrolase [Candidatus Competibacteraceae bacterium]|nr:HAD-IA family hydrolase [Candidatus Competibacteraceae bacterium]